MLGATRVAVDLPVECPAGAPIGEQLAGAGCRCRVTDTDILSATDPSSLGSFCLDPNGYRTCPVWQADKEASWKHQPVLAP